MKPKESPWFKDSGMKHRYIKTINRLMVGHSYNGKTLHLFKIKDSPNCDKSYLSQIEDNNHILFKCTAYDKERKKYNILCKFNNTIEMFKNIETVQFTKQCNFLEEINVRI